MKKKKEISKESEVLSALGIRDYLYFFGYQPQRGTGPADENSPNVFSPDFVRAKVKFRRIDRHSGIIQRISLGKWIDCPYPKKWGNEIYG